MPDVFCDRSDVCCVICDSCCVVCDWQIYMPTVMAVPHSFWKSWKSIRLCGNMDGLKVFGFCQIVKKTSKQTQPFWFFPRVAKAFLYWNLLKPLLDMLRMRKRRKCIACTWPVDLLTVSRPFCTAWEETKKYTDLLSEVLCTCAKETKQKKFLWSFLKRTLHSWSCKPNRSSESRHHLSTCFMCEGKHGWICWSHTCKTLSSRKETFPNVYECIPWEVAFHQFVSWCFEPS